MDQLRVRSTSLFALIQGTSKREKKQPCGCYLASKASAHTCALAMMPDLGRDARRLVARTVDEFVGFDPGHFEA